MNKILKFNVQNYLETLKRGGGAIDFKPPLDLNNYEKLINDLKNLLNNFKNKNEKELFILYHIDNIPPISSRLNEVFKIIFENNKITYLSNALRNEKMVFYYELSFYEIENAINKLEIVKEKVLSILKKLNLSLTDFFNALKNKDDKMHNFVSDVTDYYFENVSHISRTSLIRMLSLIYYQYNKIIENDLITTVKSNDHTIAYFSSISKLEKAKSLLSNQGIKVIKTSENSLDIQNNKKEILLEGLIKVSGYDYLNLYKTNDEEYEMSDIVYQQYWNKIRMNNARVGVIDGGIGNGSLKKYINYHTINEFPGFSNNNIIPTGDHAEQVCSILLFSDQMNNENDKDNCESPIVDLFDICYDGINIGELITLIESIIIKYYEKIKIWNLSISSSSTNDNKIIWSEGISNFGMKLDEIQKKYKVLFIIPTGNNDSDEDKLITSPSDSMMAISVASANFDGSPTKYALSGDYKNNKYYANKPDIATRAIDNDGNYITFSSRGKGGRQGTSFAAPLITRKVAQLFSEGMDLFAIPAILNAAAIFYNNKVYDEKDVYIDDYIGYGCVPNNIELIKNMSDDNCIIISKVNVKDYSHGFFKLKLPKTHENQYDLNIILSTNVNANFSKFASFEYVEDTVRTQFGAVDPFSNGNNKLNVNSKLSEIRGDSDDALTKEEDLRKKFNKYKNRYSSCKIIKKNRPAYIVCNGVKKDIESWGMTFTRNDIKSRRKNDIDVYFCLIISSINKNRILNEIHNINSIYLDNEINLNNNRDDEIKFE